MVAELKYVPLTQQKYCCVPTCIQMIFLRRNLPVYSQEEIGKYLGLIVPENVKHLFSDSVKTGEKPERGYGTQEGKEKYSLNNLFIAKNIPLQVKKIGISKAGNVHKLIEENLKKGQRHYCCL